MDLLINKLCESLNLNKNKKNELISTLKLTKHVIDNLKIDTRDGDVSLKKEKFLLLSGNFKEKKILLSEKNLESSIQSDLDKKQKIAFIDGGNAQIIGSSSFSLQAIRSRAAIFEGNNQTDILGKDFFVLGLLNDSRKSIFFDPPQNFTVFTGLGEYKNINLNEISVYDEFNSNDLTKACELSRRLSELYLCKEIMANNLAQIIVIDGSLQGLTPEENKVLKKIEIQANTKNIIVFGLSKTSSLCSKKGVPLSYIVSNFAKEQNINQAWLYFLTKNTGFVKLHANAEYVFKIEWFSNDCTDTKIFSDNFNSALETIAYFSSDSIFLGYPYGLIEADNQARITNAQVEEFKTDLMYKSKENWHELEKIAKSSDAHDILDKISF